MSTLPRLVALADDRWPTPGGVPDDVLDQVLLASHLLGADRAVANFGGGNTSAKGLDHDHLGRELETIWVKGSGSDLATMGREDFTQLRLDDTLPLFEREAMTDEEMVDHLVRCQLDPRSPRSSIETLLHAFIPAAHVHHTHPDTINAIAAADDGERRLSECFGGEAAWIPYIRPGFTLAKQVGSAVRTNPSLRLIVLAKHGLVVWGETAEEAYRRTIEVINRAADFVNSRAADTPRFGGQATAARVDGAARPALLDAILPVVRGAVSSQRAKVLAPDMSDSVQQFVSSREAAALVEVGAACPDHLVHTKRLPLWVPFDPDSETIEQLAARIPELAALYRSQYDVYFERNADPADQRADADANVILIQNVGLIGAGTSTVAAGLARDLYLRAIEVMAGAQALGGFVSLTERESFAVEYWPLELYKLSLRPPPGELQGRVALVTGAAGGIGRAVLETLAAAGACVVGFDIDAAGASAAVEALGDRGVAVAGDVTTEAGVQEAFATAVAAFGGVDIVVSNAGVAASAPIEETTLADWERIHAVLTTGYFLAARAAFALLRRQNRGGAIIVIGSKNALVAGPNATAYSAAKAAEVHLARCLAEEGGVHGIRVNVVNPDAVIEGSRIWNSSWREERAAAYNITPGELAAYYRDRTTLRVNVLPEDVAQAVLHFASPGRSGKSTGNILNVDGGIRAAYPR